MPSDPPLGHWSLGHSVIPIALSGVGGVGAESENQRIGESQNRRIGEGPEGNSLSLGHWSFGHLVILIALSGIGCVRTLQNRVGIPSLQTGPAPASSSSFYTHFPILSTPSWNGCSTFRFPANTPLRKAPNPAHRKGGVRSRARSPRREEVPRLRPGLPDGAPVPSTGGAGPGVRASPAQTGESRYIGFHPRTPFRPSALYPCDPGRWGTACSVPTELPPQSAHIPSRRPSSRT